MTTKTTTTTVRHMIHCNGRGMFAFPVPFTAASDAQEALDVIAAREAAKGFNVTREEDRVYVWVADPNHVRSFTDWYGIEEV